ncbi:hypothetical protein K431DRAFT_349869 [Polychaeton citri CBS 116435]|uniref:Uncharacterized protein n=1 Tax=Polychaeton citri CBS 116435 TaxID=1314669 RepID=A0A9P4Q2Y4_9PEZI|nr:hypothetical protein K431DRAFT_349869 [Polychaeton citri CBS 116435]
MKAPSTALLRTFSPLWSAQTLPWTARGCLLARQIQVQQANSFSTSQPQLARKRQGPKKDPKITQIRYHLQHPLTPRPLRFSRNRALRHWTIHRAWQLYQYNLRRDRELELERQYNSMRYACEQLRLIDNNGLTFEERERLGVSHEEASASGGTKGKEEGRLYRIAMQKKGIWEGVPIEYARIQTETPARDGWNSSWTR